MGAEAIEVDVTLSRHVCCWHDDGAREGPGWPLVRALRLLSGLVAGELMVSHVGKLKPRANRRDWPSVTLVIWLAFRHFEAQPRALAN